MTDRTKTLDQLEAVEWPPPDYDSHLVRRCHALRRVPLNAFSAEDLRIMLGQLISVRLLAPVAFDVLERDPLTSGDFYPGDLLAALVRARTGWERDADLRRRTLVVLDRALDEVSRRLAPEFAISEDGLNQKLAVELRKLYEDCAAALKLTHERPHPKNRHHS